MPGAGISAKQNAEKLFCGKPAIKTLDAINRDEPVEGWGLR